MTFTPKETEIFAFKLPDETVRYADPMRIQRRLSQATMGNIDSIFIDACSELPKAALAVEDDKGNFQYAPQIESLKRLQALEKLIRASVFAFEMPVYDAQTNQGCTEDYLYRLVVSFVDWQQKKS